MSLVAAWDVGVVSADLTASPAVKNGDTTAGEERGARAKMCLFMQRAGQQMRMPTRAICTAMHFFHKYYMTYRMPSDKTSRSVYNVCAACLYLASKTEECRKRVREVMETVHFQSTKKKAPDPKDNAPENRKLVEKVLGKEVLLLQALQFDFNVDHPLRYLPKIFSTLAAYAKLPEKRWKEYCKAAWFFSYDSYRLALCVSIPAWQIALLCAELGIRFENTRAQGTNQKLLSPPVLWFQEFDGTMEIEAFEVVLRDIISILEDQAAAVVPKDRLRKRRKECSKRKLHIGKHRFGSDPLIYDSAQRARKRRLYNKPEPANGAAKQAQSVDLTEAAAKRKRSRSKSSKRKPGWKIKIQKLPIHEFGVDKKGTGTKDSYNKLKRVVNKYGTVTNTLIWREKDGKISAHVTYAEEKQAKAAITELTSRAKDFGNIVVTGTWGKEAQKPAKGEDGRAPKRQRLDPFAKKILHPF